MERLKSAKLVEELLDQFPKELEIVSCRISISGKDIKYAEYTLANHHLIDIFGSVHAGHKIFVEYIRVKKSGGSSVTFQYAPVELVVAE